MGRYQIIRRLAIGPTAEVFLGRNAEGTAVALKRLLPSLAEDERVVKRFWREAKLAQAIRHPNLVHVPEWGEGDGANWLVMELVDGADVRALLAAAASRGLPLTLREASAILLPVADALHHLHQAKDARGNPLGAIHRNVTPSNLLVSRRGEAKLGDLGLVRIGADAGRSGGTIVAKTEANYLSPEQAAGKKVDERADVFLLGLNLYELLAGLPLFSGPNALAQVRSFDLSQLPELPDAPREVRRVLEKALARDPSMRYPTAKAFSEGLLVVLDQKRIKGNAADLVTLFTKVLPTKPAISSLGPDEHAGELELKKPSPDAPRPPPPVEEGPPAEVPTRPLPARFQPAPGGNLPRAGIVPAPAAPGRRATSPVEKAEPRKLGEILVEKGRVDPKRVQAALKAQKDQGGKLGDHLRAQGVAELDVIRAMSVQTGIAFLADERLDTTAVEPELLVRLPRAVATRLACVPLLDKRGAIYVAMLDPQDPNALAELQTLTGARAIRPVFATEAALDRALQRLYPEAASDPGEEFAERTSMVSLQELGMKADDVAERPLPPPAVPGEPEEETEPQGKAVRKAVPAQEAGAQPTPGSLGPAVLAGALRVLGGVATEGPALGALARRLAEKLGEKPALLSEVEAAGLALVLAARFEKKDAFARPSAGSIRAVFGAHAPGLLALLSHAVRDLAPGRPKSRGAEALACVAAFAEAAGTAAPAPEVSSFALSEIETDEKASRDGRAALEQLLTAHLR